MRNLATQIAFSLNQDAMKLRQKHNVMVHYSYRYGCYVDGEGRILGATIASADHVLTKRKAQA